MKRLSQENAPIYEALKLGTKVLVMNHGAIQQYAAPKELLHAPANDFVKKFFEMKEVLLINK